MQSRPKSEPWLVDGEVRGSEAAGRVEVWTTSLSTKVFHNNVLLKEFNSCEFKSNNSHGGIKLKILYIMEFSITSVLITTKHVYVKLSTVII